MNQQKFMNISPYDYTVLNDEGRKKAFELAEAFSFLHRFVLNMLRPQPPFVATLADPDGSGYPAVNTEEAKQFAFKLQEASFYAKRAMAILPENQE